MPSKSSVVILNPRTCGIYKDGRARFKTDPATGLRTDEIDNELMDQVTAYLAGTMPAGSAEVDLQEAFAKQVLVPAYYDERFNDSIRHLLRTERLKGITIGELADTGVISVRGGHGSPSNDQRMGHIPYVKVSDIRGLRININPTNLLTAAVAERFWRGGSSGLEAWDLVTPNRASSNIGEFAVLLPGEEQVVLTKEVFVLRVIDDSLIDPFYLLWALSLKAVRDQWRRVVLMQTNREDCGSRYREIVIPLPRDKQWAAKTAEPFRAYFKTIAEAKTSFVDKIHASKFQHIANVVASVPATDAEEEGIEPGLE